MLADTHSPPHVTSEIPTLWIPRQVARANNILYWGRVIARGGLPFTGDYPVLAVRRWFLGTIGDVQHDVKALSP